LLYEAWVIRDKNCICIEWERFKKCMNILEADAKEYRKVKGFKDIKKPPKRVVFDVFSWILP
jgi:hypothetical protein